MQPNGIVRALISVLCLTAASTSVYAARFNPTHDSVQTELRLNTGYLTGESGEFVYDAYGLGSGIPGYKVSQLDWKLDNVYMAGIGASIDFYNRFRINADYWRNAVDGEGTMDDYDWLYVGLDWSHWSHHEDTVVTDVSTFDVNGELTMVSFDKGNSNFTALFGYKQDHMAWEASGGTGTYSFSSFRDTNIIFFDIPVISYEQTFKMPYIGLGYRGTGYNGGLPIVLNANVRYSNRVHGEDIDIHHLRDLRFEESGDGGKWLAFNLNLDFYITQSWALSFGFEQQTYEEIKTPITVTDMLTGVTTVYSGPAAGLDHTSNKLSVDVSYKF